MHKLVDLLRAAVGLSLAVFSIATLFVVMGFACVFIGPLVSFGFELGHSVLEWLGLPTWY